MRSCARHAVALSLLSLLCAAPAAAQLKPKLPKLNPLAKKEASRTAPSPTFNDRVLEITDERAGRLLKGYAAEAAALDAQDRRLAAARAGYEEENKKHPARLREWETRHAKWETCQQQVVKPAEAQAEAEIEQSQNDLTGGDQAAFERKMEDIKQRMQAAQAEGDMAEVMRLADSLQRATAPSAAAAGSASARMQDAGRTCGAEPEKPEPPTPPASNTPDIDAAGAQAAGLTPEQYAILRERVQYAVGEDGVVEVSSSQWAFSESELAVLRKRGKELSQAYRPIRDRGH